VSGKARGADSLGETWGNEKNVPIKSFPANWDLYGKRAGYLRNTEMADYADGLIAFWDGESKGTKHMIDTANNKGLEVHIIKY
jgi:glycerophosphoryl diester phosphodiesterase